MEQYSPEEVYKWGLPELWAALQVKVQEDEELKERYQDEIERIKRGRKLRIPIWYLTNEWYDLYPTGRRATVHGYGKYDIDLLMEEKEERETLIRRILLEEYDTGTTTAPRNR